jgi:protein-arginine kinase activator protein McsA
MKAVDKPLTEKFLEAVLGCPNCGRFDHLSIESAHSEHRQGWAKFSCSACYHTFTAPIREPIVADAKAKTA